MPSGTATTIQIDEERHYDIQEVSFLTGYSRKYLRNIENEGKIPKADRDERGWRIWLGKNVVKIIKYKEACAKRKLKWRG